MVSDSELVVRLHEILRSSDLETTTAAGVRRRIEEEFSVNLYERRVFIREQIDLFLRDAAAQNDVAEQEGEEVDDNAQNDDVEEEQEQSENAGGDENAQEGEVSEEEEEVSDKERSKRKKSTATDVKKKGGGFCKPCALSPQLQELFGVSELARTEVVKKLWEYIREHNLQNPKDRRKILCDEALHQIFRVKSVDMFKMNKALSKHIWPLDEVERTPVKSSQRKRQRKQDREEDEPKTKEKPKKGAGSGLTAPLPLSDALVKFFGTGEYELSRANVVKKMWQYIKDNDLQDPSDKRRVLCDKKLKQLFEVDSFHGFTVSKLLASHFIKNQR